MSNSSGDVETWWLSLIHKDDLPFESDLTVTSSLGPWQRYVDHKKSKGDWRGAFFVYERALSLMPGSYKLWKEYLDDRQTSLLQQNIISMTEVASINAAYERALLYMHRMPRIWLDYLSFLCRQRGLVTFTRSVFDRSLRALPITLHSRIWDLYVKYAKGIQSTCPSTAIHILKRYMQLAPTDSEQLLTLLIEAEHYNDAVEELVRLAQQALLKNKQLAIEYWEQLCQLLLEHATDIRVDIKVYPLLRIAIDAFPGKQGEYWNALALVHTKRGEWQEARDVWWEAIQLVTTVKDFVLVFDSLTKFEETLLELNVAQQDEGIDSEILVDIERYAALLRQRKQLLAEVKIRQTPHNGERWIERANVEEEKARQAAVLERAIHRIKPLKSTALDKVWIALARAQENMDNTRTVYERAIKVHYPITDDLVTVWIAYAEDELRVVASSDKSGGGEELSSAFKDVMSRACHNELVKKSTRLWSFYIDILESYPNLVESVRTAYDQMIALRVCLPQHIINYALFLEDNNLPEDAFRVYERGIDIFGWPVAFEFWNIYLPKYIKWTIGEGDLSGLSGVKLERVRELFEQAVKGIPTQYARALYVMYAETEEKHGHPRRCLGVLSRACNAVDDKDRPGMYRIYLTKTAAIMGVIHCRDVYTAAIKALPDADSREMCLDFAQMEVQLGEFERARAVYGHAAQFSDPRTCPSLWDCLAQL